LLELTSRTGEAMPFPALLAASRDRLLREGLIPEADFESALRFYLCRAGLPGLIEFSWGPLPFTMNVTERPFAHPLARWLLRQGAPSVLSYNGRFVEVNGVLGRHLLSLLDGTRDQTALVIAMKAFLAEKHGEAQTRGEPANLPAPDDPLLAVQLQRSLTGLANLGLLRRE
jgi:hypothetical protein